MVSLSVSFLSPNSQWKICVISKKNDTAIEDFQVVRQTKMDDLFPLLSFVSKYAPKYYGVQFDIEMASQFQDK